MLLLSQSAGFGLPVDSAVPGKGRMWLGREMEEERRNMRGVSKTSILPNPPCFFVYLDQCRMQNRPRSDTQHFILASGSTLTCY